MRIVRVSFLVAISFAGLGAIFRGCSSARNSNVIMKEQANSDIKPSQVLAGFNEITSVKGTTEEGAPYSTQIYESSDSVRVLLMRENHDSPARANKELRERLETALEIVERGPRIDQQSQSGGERVIAKFANKDFSEEEIAILWADGQQLFSIRSSSLTVALEFEKQFNR